MVILMVIECTIAGRGVVAVVVMEAKLLRCTISAVSLGSAIAALAGFLPLVVANGAGAHSQQSLGTVIFGGLVVATVLSLGVVPPVYVLVKNLEQRLFTAEDDTRQSSASA